jgi:hypothetical protein
MDIVNRLRTVDISWSQEAEWCAEAADEIIQLREHKNQCHELLVLFVEKIKQLRRGLHRIASMSSDPEFGVPPMTTVQKIAQDALDDE